MTKSQCSPEQSEMLTVPSLPMETIRSICIDGELSVTIYKECLMVTTLTPGCPACLARRSGLYLADQLAWLQRPQRFSVSLYEERQFCLFKWS